MSPKSPPSPRPSKRTVEPPEPPGPVNILCIDDSPLDLELLVALVREAATNLGVEVNVVGEIDAVHGVYMARQLRPQIVFVDVLMPKLDGFTVDDRIAQIPGVEVETRVIVTAARDRATDAVARARGLLVLDKPVYVRNVEEVLRSAGVVADADDDADDAGATAGAEAPTATD